MWLVMKLRNKEQSERSHLEAEDVLTTTAPLDKGQRSTRVSLVLSVLSVPVLSVLSVSQGSSFQMSDLKDPGVYKPLLIGVMLMIFQQFTGINAIMFYAETIFEQAHFKVRGFFNCYLYSNVQFGKRNG